MAQRHPPLRPLFRVRGMTSRQKWARCRRASLRPSRSECMRRYSLFPDHTNFGIAIFRRSNTLLHPADAEAGVAVVLASPEPVRTRD